MHWYHTLLLHSASFNGCATFLNSNIHPSSPQISLACPFPLQSWWYFFVFHCCCWSGDKKHNSISFCLLTVHVTIQAYRLHDSVISDGSKGKREECVNKAISYMMRECKLVLNWTQHLESSLANRTCEGMVGKGECNKMFHAPPRPLSGCKKPIIAADDTSPLNYNEAIWPN